MNRILNIFCCGILLMLFTSYLSTNANENLTPKINSFNTLQFSGSINKEILADLHFSISTEISKSGVSISKLNLELENTNENLLSLLISNDNRPISKGSYRISNKKTKSNSGYEGVFGYLNIVNSQELPFYTENGKIVITNIDNDSLKGYLNLELENFNGKSVLVTGNFLAKKKI